MMFVIGGDGTQHGASTLADAVKARGLECAVVGIPKTVDNDFLLIDRSFGFETAVQQAKEAIASNAHGSSFSAKLYFNRKTYGARIRFYCHISGTCFS